MSKYLLVEDETHPGTGQRLITYKDTETDVLYLCIPGTGIVMLADQEGKPLTEKE